MSYFLIRNADSGNILVSTYLLDERTIKLSVPLRTIIYKLLKCFGNIGTNVMLTFIIRIVTQHIEEMQRAYGNVLLTFGNVI